MQASVIKEVRALEIEPNDPVAVKSPSIRSISVEAEQIGDKIVKVEFIEFLGKRKKKVTRVEVKQADLDRMLSESGNSLQAQYALF